MFFFDCLCQQDALVGRVVLSALFAFFEQGFAVDDAQVVVGGKVHQEAEHLGIVGFQFFIDGNAADVVHQHGAHPFRVGEAVVFGERGQDAAQAFRPVAGTENLAGTRCAVDDDFVGVAD